MLLFALFFNLPLFGFGLIQRIEQRPSYLAACRQPLDLRAQLPSADAVVAMEGDDYDLFKPQFRHMTPLDFLYNAEQFARIDAVANCYDGFDGGPDVIRPLPAGLDASDFRMIQATPQRFWMTLFGHRINNLQWGYGCDLYIRNDTAQVGASPHS
jgi:hypothetical protein